MRQDSCHTHRSNHDAACLTCVSCKGSDKRRCSDTRHGYLWQSLCFRFINATTRCTVLVTSLDETPASCATALMQYAAVVRITEIFRTDNGPEYTAQVTQELTRILGKTWQFTLTYRPQANGIVERQNQEILRHVRVLMLYQDTWGKWSSPWILSLAQLSLNTRIYRSTGCTPVELTFGTAARQYFLRPQDLRR